MSDEKPQSKGKVVSHTEPSKDVVGSEAVAMPEVIVDKVKNEVTFVGPTGQQSVKFRTKVIEEEEEEKEPEPMTPEEFRVALEAVDKLGLTWTADLIPLVKAKSPENEPSLASKELQDLETKYPNLNFEIHWAVSYALIGSKISAGDAGGEDWLEKKAATVNDILVDHSYRSEFFFKHAIKIPYLKDIDWEVVFKAFERGISRPLGVPYGVLALTLQDPFFTGKTPSVRRVTVAVDTNLVNELLTILNEVKVKLETAGELTSVLSKQRLLEEKSNDDKPKPELGR